MTTTLSRPALDGGDTHLEPALTAQQREEVLTARFTEASGPVRPILVLLCCGLLYGALLAADWALNADSLLLYLRELPTNAVHLFSGVLATGYTIAGFLALLAPPRWRTLLLAVAAVLVLLTSLGVGAMRYLGADGTQFEAKSPVLSEWLPLLLPPLLAVFTFTLGALMHGVVMNAVRSLRLLALRRAIRRLTEEYGRRQAEHTRRERYAQSLTALHDHLEEGRIAARAAVDGRLARARAHARYLMARHPGDHYWLREDDGEDAR